MGIVYGLIMASYPMRFATRAHRFLSTALNLSPTAEGTSLGCPFAWTARLSTVAACIGSAHRDGRPTKVVYGYLWV